MADCGLMPAACDAQHNYAKLNLFSCLSYVVGCIIGSAIFVTPSTVLRQSGSVGLALVFWVVGAVVSFIGSIVYIELGTSIPKSGSDFSYAVYVGWESIAFAFMLVSLFASPAYGGVLVATLGDYAVAAITVVTGPISWSFWASRLIGGICIAILTYINCFAISKYTSPLQMVVTSAKVLALAAVITIGVIFTVEHGVGDHFVEPFAGSVSDPGSIILTAYGVLFSYAGWEILNNGCAEVKNPRRTLPLAMLISLTLVTATYLLINLSFFSVLTVPEIVESKALIVTLTDKVLGSRFSWIVSVVITVFMIGTINAMLFANSRYFQAAAVEGHLPAIVSALHLPSGSPRVAVVYLGIGSIILSLVDVSTLISCMSFVSWGHRVVSSCILLLIRHKNIPVADGAIRFPLIFAILLLAISCCLVCIPVVTKFQYTAVGLGLFVFAMALYYLVVKPDRQIKRLAGITESVNAFITKLLDVTIPPHPSPSKAEFVDHAVIQDA